MATRDEERLAALPKRARELIEPLLGLSASKWTMAKAEAVDEAVTTAGCSFEQLPAASELGRAQRALLELCATHPEIGLRRLFHRFPRWSMRRWLGIDPPGALERLAWTPAGRDVPAIKAFLEGLPMPERLRAFGELDAGAYGATTEGLELPGEEALRDEGRDWAPAYADWLIELGRPDADPFCQWHHEHHPAIRVPLFLSLARSSIPVERRWEVFFPRCVDRPAVLRECIEALSPDRRAAILADVLAVFVAKHVFPVRASVDVGAVLGKVADLFAAHPPPSIIEAAFARHLAGLHRPRREVLTALGALGKQIPALAPAFKKDGKKPLKLTVKRRALPPEAALSALDKARLAKLDEWTHDLVEQLDVTDKAGGRRYQALVHAGSDGAIFADGSSDVVAIIAQGGADGDDAPFCAAFDEAFVAYAKKSR